MFYQLCELFAGIMEMSIIVTAQMTLYLVKDENMGTITQDLGV